MFVILTVHVFKHMDSSLIEVDIQPNYVRVTLKGKSLQLALNDEIRPGAATAQRSQTTGYLVIKMPKLNAALTQETVANSKTNAMNKNEKEEMRKEEKDREK